MLVIRDSSCNRTTMSILGSLHKLKALNYKVKNKFGEESLSLRKDIMFKIKN